MSGSLWLAHEQIAKFSPSLPKWHGKPPIADRLVENSIMFIYRDGLRLRYAGGNR